MKMGNTAYMRMKGIRVKSLHTMHLGSAVPSSAENEKLVAQFNDRNV